MLHDVGQISLSAFYSRSPGARNGRTPYQRKWAWLDGGCSNKNLAPDPYLHQLWPFPKNEEKVKRSVAVIKSPLIKARTRKLTRLILDFLFLHSQANINFHTSIGNTHWPPGFSTMLTVPQLLQTWCVHLLSHLKQTFYTVRQRTGLGFNGPQIYAGVVDFTQLS